MGIAKYSNNAQSTLAGSISDSTTTITLAAGGGAEFPTLSAGEQFTATITDAATGLLREIVVCTARVGDTLTVVRGQEGTTALNWSANDLFAQLNTAGQMAALVQQEQAQAQSYNYAADIGSANNYLCTLNPSLSTPVNGMPIRVLIANNNTGASTLNAGAGAIAIKRRDGSALIGGELVADMVAVFAYNSAMSAYQLLELAPATDAAVAAGTDTESAITPAQLAAAITSIAPPGMIAGYAGGVIPGGWLLCDGSAVSRTTYAALFAAIGTQYGSTSGSNFKVPDLRGRTLIGLDGGANRVTSATMSPDGNTLGAVGGAQQVTLTAAEQASMPVSGTCSATGTTDQTSTVNTSGQGAAFGNIFSGGGQTAYSAAPVVTVNGTIIGTATGSGGAHLNMQPSLAAYWMIKT